MIGPQHVNLEDSDISSHIHNLVKGTGKKFQIIYNRFKSFPNNSLMKISTNDLLTYLFVIRRGGIKNSLGFCSFSFEFCGIHRFVATFSPVWLNLS